MGIASALMFVAGIALGWWLDGILGTFPVFVLVGIALGIGGGAYHSFVKIRTFMRD
jgi:F0F1-type ATP synthase assembly protein I